jgi:L-fuconate dehydratase
MSTLNRCLASKADRAAPAGRAGFCEYVQHVAIFDHIAVGGSLEDRVVEFVEHRHEPSVAPSLAGTGRYVVPTEPGCRD